MGSAVSTVSLLTQSFEGANSKLKNMTAATNNNISQSQPNVSAATASSNAYSSVNRASFSTTPNLLPGMQPKTNIPVSGNNVYIPYQSAYCTTIALAQKVPDISITSPPDGEARPATAIGHMTVDKAGSAASEAPEMPDLSSLSEEERKVIEAVMKRQENEDNAAKNQIELVLQRLFVCQLLLIDLQGSGAIFF